MTEQKYPTPDAGITSDDSALSVEDHAAHQAATLEAIIVHIRDLPTLPAVAIEIMNNLDNEDVDLDSIIEKIALDHSITAKVLRVANSSHYGANSKFVTLQQAVAMLGLKNLKNLVSMSALMHSIAAPTCEGFDFTAFWRHSASTAVCAEVISRTLRMKNHFAFTAGLLHDIGRLVLAASLPLKYAEVIRYRREHDCQLLDAERAVLGIDHILAGQALADHWQFSDVIRDAIKAHHYPTDSGNGALAQIIHVADAITHALDLSQLDDDLVPAMSLTAWKQLALQESDYFAIFHETELRFNAIDHIVA